jgi:osmotically-inducible protein OsmY
MSKLLIGNLVMVVALAGAVACSEDTDRPAVDADVNESRAEDAAEETGDALERAGDRVAGAVESAGDSAAGAVQTADIKTALAADDVVDADDVDVDTNGTTKVVTLKGTVRTAAQRERAEAIAKREAEGYRVVNQLVVRS